MDEGLLLNPSWNTAKYVSRLVMYLIGLCDEQKVSTEGCSGVIYICAASVSQLLYNCGSHVDLVNWGSFSG